jgi:hypothetical protein
MRAACFTALAALATAAVTVFAATTASANAEIQDGPATIYITGDGLTVYQTAATLAVGKGYPGNLQAYYLIVPPGGDSTKAEKHYSEHTFTGPLEPGVARDSYGPTGGFLNETKICAGWWDPSHSGVTIPGFPCATIHS